MPELELIAATPMGLEAVTARELKQLGYGNTRTENGRVTFQGGLLDICRANLWLRSADRVLIKMAEFEALSFEQLFEQTKALHWAEWIPEKGEFPVNGRSHHSQLSSVPACQGIVKKAVVESLKQHYHTEWFAESGPCYTIEVSLLNDKATITLDTTGPSLHKRGYRKLVTGAPLKETMAASLVLLSRWDARRPLYDPFCGSGTIPLEAAMIGWNIAPGLRRTFHSEAWPAIPQSLWQQAREEAYDALKDDEPLNIVGSDIDPHAIEVAQAAAKSAGLSREITLQTLPVDRIRPQGDYGCIVTNPPYGQRLGSPDEAENAIRQFGLAIKPLDTWSLFVLSPYLMLERALGRKADKKRKLFNGRIQCNLHQFFGPLPPLSPSSSSSLPSPKVR